tara:strand:+ start:476 stop:1165 length:690 start_codon:yes stop_codon:yes gene_type:complete
MKTLLFSLVTLLGVTLGNAGLSAVDLAENISVDASVSYSNLSTSGGLAVREDSLGYSVLLGTSFEGGVASVGVDIYDADGGTDTDLSISWARPVTILGQSLEAEIYFQQIESSYGGWEEAGLGLTYSNEWADVTATLWHELGTDASYGVEITVSRDFTVPVENLTVSPFVAVNIANDYNAVEVGVSADYDFGNNLSVGAKVSYNHNDVDGSAYSLDNDWVVGAGFNYKF